MKTTRPVKVGDAYIGGSNRITIQSMTNSITSNADDTIEQIKQLAQAGCDIVRVSVPDIQSAAAVREIVDASPIPVVADIHFDYKLAISAAENGINKLRINPGNIGGMKNVQAVADCAKYHGIPIRVGVNAGSLPRDILHEYKRTPQAMVESARRHILMLESVGFYDIVLSLKASDVKLCVDSYRLASEQFDYPMHLGVTEAGLPGMGNIKSAIGIGALLLDGIGDTIRVSLTGSPIPEVHAAREILSAVGLYNTGVEIISCPTCARSDIDVESIARRVEEGVAGIRCKIKAAVMGCAVNGPGEARHADIGIAGGKSGGVLFKTGCPPKKVHGDLAETLIREIKELCSSSIKD